MSGVDFMQGMMGHMMDSINCCMLGKIEEFDSKKMKAEILPLLKSKEDEVKSLLIEVPVAFFKTDKFYIRPPFKEGDIVLVIFSDEDMDNALLTGDVSKLATERRHSMDDAIVIGGILPFNKELEDDFDPSDLVVVGENNSIVLKEDGDIEIVGKDISIQADSVNITTPNDSGSW